MNLLKDKKMTIGIIILIGLVTTIKLGIIYYNANFNPYALSSFCSVNDFIDCDGIAKTTESQFFGVPLAFWGMFLYAFMGLMLFVDKLKNFKLLRFLEVFKNPFSYIAALGVISFGISMLLLCISLFEIKKLCVLCAFTYILNLFIAVVAAQGVGFKQVFVDSVKDLLDALKIKPYAIAFSIVVLIATAFLTYTSTSYVFTPQVKRVKEFKEFTQAKTNKYAVSGNILGSKNPDVIIHTYTDYQCPMCKAYNIMVHKLAKDFKNVQIVHHNMPLDTSCNRYIRKEFHQGACTMAKYAVAAEKQGKFWDMNNVLFEKQPTSTKEILMLADKMKLDLTKLQDDANSIETMKEIQNDIDEAYSYKINGTPSTVINGKSHIGMRPYSDMKQWVIDEGGIKK